MKFAVSLFEIAVVFVRLDYVTSTIVNANRGIMRWTIMAVWTVDAHRDGKRFVVRAADPPHGRGGLPGTKGGKGVDVGAGVAVATCACALAKKAIKPTRTHSPTIAIPNRIRVFIAEVSSTSHFMSIMAAFNHKAP